MNLQKTKTQVCVKWIVDSCRYGETCPYAHGPGDVRPFVSTTPYRIVDCREWVTSAVCYYGHKCTFIHRKPSYVRYLNVAAFRSEDDDLATMLPTRATRLQSDNGPLLHELLDPYKTNVVTQIRELIAPLSPRGLFPGPNPCSIERADLTRVLNAYWVCEKTDGMRALLCFLTYNGIKLAVAVTRAWDVFVLRVRHVPKVLFQGTVFDGELISIPRPTWLGFDAVFVAGIPVFNRPLSHRLNAAERGLSTYVYDPRDTVELAFKTYFKNLEMYKTYAASSPHPNDGHIFTPESSPVVVGRHQSLFKLKTGGRHTVDFEFFNPDILRVYDPQRRESVSVGHLVREDASPLLKDGCIVESAWVHGTDWTFVCVRIDKDRSNDMLTFTKTMTNIRENLQMSDLEARWIAWK